MDYFCINALLYIHKIDFFKLKARFLDASVTLIQHDSTILSLLGRDKFVDKRELIVTEMERTAHQLEVEETETFGRGRFARYQKCVWDLMEKPESSMAAKIVSIISMSFVFVSIVGMVISTLPALQYKVT